MASSPRPAKLSVKRKSCPSSETTSQTKKELGCGTGNADTTGRSVGTERYSEWQSVSLGVCFCSSRTTTKAQYRVCVCETEKETRLERESLNVTLSAFCVLSLCVCVDSCAECGMKNGVRNEERSGLKALLLYNNSVLERVKTVPRYHAHTTPVGLN